MGGTLDEALAAWDKYGEAGLTWCEPCGRRVPECACRNGRPSVICKGCGAIYPRGGFPHPFIKDEELCPQCKDAAMDFELANLDGTVEFTDHQETIRRIA